MAAPRAGLPVGSVETPSRVRPEVAAEAAVWVARLHGPERSASMERECRAWQARSAEHREAFERCTETWQDVPRVSLASAYASAGGGALPAAAPARSLRWAAVAAMGVLLVSVGLLLPPWRDAGVYNTGVGEQRQVVLDDGTRLSLNTGTRVRVDLGAGQRRVAVEGGEALFEVRSDPARPFVVRAGGSEVEALGTTFAVRFTREDPQPGAALTVTLIEGRVAVRPLAVGGVVGHPSSRQDLRLQAGERVRWSSDSAGEPTPRVDRPNIDAVLAWQRSEAVFDDATLPEAVAEMNRYTRTPIVLLDAPALGSLRVSGLYRTSDSAGFARAVAALHGLSVQERQGRLELGKPQ